MIILFGLAGSGKGTQAKILSEMFGWRAFSVGQVLRDTGGYEPALDKGELVPDEDVVRLMDKQIDRAEAEGYDVILDGYPRTLVQAEHLLEKRASDINGAIVIDVPKEELYNRLALRGRDDDKEKSSVDRRFEIFEQNICSILPLLEKYHIPVAHINGVGEVGTVAGRLIAAVQQFNPNATKQTSDVNGGEIEKSYGE